MNDIPGQVVSPYRRHLKRVGVDELVRVVQRLAAQEAARYARLVEAVAELRGRSCMIAAPAPDPVAESLARDEVARSELAAALRISSWQAGQDIQVAAALDERMFSTMNMLRAGAISPGKAQIIARQAIPLAQHTFQEARKQGMSPREAEKAARDVVRRLEEMVLPKVPELTPGQVRNRAEKAVATLAPDYVEERRRAAARDRNVQPPSRSSADPGGQDMQDLFIHLPAPEAQAAYNTIDAYARAMRQAGDERTLEELRADTLTHLILRGHPPTERQVAGPNSSYRNSAVAPVAACAAGAVDELTAERACGTSDAPTVGRVDDRPATAPMDWSRAGAGFDRYGLRANVEVVVSLETLLGISDAPGHLAGHGAITAQVARDIAFKAGSTWQRLVIDDRGRVIDAGCDRYVPPEPLKRYIRGRDRSCRTPWCDRPAATCDIDHVQPWPGGPTTAHNLQCKCRRCHRLKHEGHWRHEVLDDGTIRMVSPAGLEYFSEPVDLRPVPVPGPGPGARPQPTSVPDRGDPPF